MIADLRACDYTDYTNYTDYTPYTANPGRILKKPIPNMQSCNFGIDNFAII